MKAQRNCILCGKHIPFRFGVQRYYCSDKCAIEYDAARNKAERARKEALGVKV